MTGWSPAAWGDFSVVGIVVVTAFLFLLSLQRGWLVLGTHHRETIDGYRRENDRLIDRSGKDAESIGTLSRAIVEKNAAEDATTRIMAAVHEMIAERQ